MNTEEIQVVRVERPDDVPVLLALLGRLRVAELFDRHHPPHRLWAGELSPGEVVCVWLAFLLSQGDHRLYKLQHWAEQNLLTLRACLGKPVRALDFHDDRLADLLGALPALWPAFEADLNAHTVRVYDLDASLFRIDTTTANSSAAVLSEQGLIQFGHSKGDPLRPQLKVAACALDPLGLPLTTAVVPGDRADDPLYVPQIRKVQARFPGPGKTFVGDCKMAALGTRAHLADTRDHYLCPLSEKQMPRRQRLERLEAVWRGEQQLAPVYRPVAADQPGEPERIAQGFGFDEACQAQLDGRTVSWTERRWLVRSTGFAASLGRKLQQRLSSASEELERLSRRKWGSKRLAAAGSGALLAAGQAVLEKHEVAGLLVLRVRTERLERAVRGYGAKAARAQVREIHGLEVSRDEGAIEREQRQLGWQVYASNDVGLPLEAVVLAYRGQYHIEDGWSRLKGRPLSLEPMYLQDEGRMEGLVLLLMVALRVLTLAEWQARQQLCQGAEKLKGIYPGQAGRQTNRPSAELLLGAFRGMSLSVIAVAGRHSAHITALNPLQQRLLALWGLPADLFHRLTLHCLEPPSP